MSTLPPYSKLKIFSLLYGVLNFNAHSIHSVLFPKKDNISGNIILQGSIEILVPFHLVNIAIFIEII